MSFLSIEFQRVKSFGTQIPRELWVSQSLDYKPDRKERRLEAQ